MNELVTQIRAEVAVARANDFLETERRGSLDGEFAAEQVAERVAGVAETAEGILQAIPHPEHDGFFVPLSSYNANDYDTVAATLPGYIVLVPSTMVDPKSGSKLYPAAVSEDGLKTGTIRLHVLQQPYRQQISYGAGTILSAAGQSETKGIGDHERTVNNGVEAEHFSTLLAAATRRDVQSAWKAGAHINHEWRTQKNSSVNAEVSRRIFGKEIPQSTITITREQVSSGQAVLLWHKGMYDQETNAPEAATKENALVVVQGLGYEAVLGAGPGNSNSTIQGQRRLDAVKELIAV